MRCRTARNHYKDQHRGSRQARGYDAAWERLRRAAIAAAPWCVDCGTPGTPDNPLTGDHLRWPARTVADVAVRCRVCNSRRGPARGRRAFRQAASRTPISARSPITLPNHA